jgi:hypothetical protein
MVPYRKQNFRCWIPIFLAGVESTTVVEDGSHRSELGMDDSIQTLLFELMVSQTGKDC